MAKSRPSSRSFSGPPRDPHAGDRLPATITRTADDNLRWQAERSWRAAAELRDCIVQAGEWVRRLEAGEAVDPNEMLVLHDRVGRAANTLYDSRAIHPDAFPLAILAKFPELPAEGADWLERYDREHARRKLPAMEDMAEQLEKIQAMIETAPGYLLTEEPAVPVRTTETTVNSQELPNPAPTLLSVADLAAKYQIAQEPLRKRLDRWRKGNWKGWKELAPGERSPREPRFLYQESSVISIIEEMQIASDERPTKKKL